MGAHAELVDTLPTPLVVYATRGFDNYTYALHPFSGRRLKQAHPETRLPSRITIAFDAQDVVDQLLGEVFGQAAPLLTGLPLADLEKLGGIEVREPGSDRVLWQWPPARR
ncbi:MAG: hypothetical protein HY909_10555 [Deltaproteobacteria bacterium]|nr:hypothetical protein [Deltaproteobacteria bacterium]